jgi:NADPH:quinone reductase-like Zn-dependent oxidoreductase
MKTIHLTKFGIENLSLTDTARPEPGPHEVLVKIKAVSFNYLDLMIIHGQYDPKLALPHVPASDGAGEVEATGTAVTRWKKGDRVVTQFIQDWISGSKSLRQYASRTGLDRPGVLQEYIVIPETALVRVPAHLSFEEASTLPIAGLTAWTALVDYAHLKIGQTVLTQGTGGVSVFALQLAKAAGARVIATSSSPEKLARLKALGADDVINYKQIPEWQTEVKRLTQGEGADVILDVGGTETLNNSLQAIKADGFIGLVGNLSGAVVPFNIYSANPANVTLRGVSVGPVQSFEAFVQALEINRIKPVVDKVFSLEAVQEAYRYMESQQFFGKVVVRIE